MRTSRIASSTVFLLILAGIAIPAAAFRVSHDYYVYATHSDGIPITGDDYFDGQVYTTGDFTKTGDHGNYGTAYFSASLQSGIVSAHAHAHGTQISTYDFPSATGRVEQISMMDNLTYTVPAGTYPEGVQVSISGWARGEIISDVGAGAEAGLWIAHGTEVYQTGVLVVGIDESGTIVVNDDITLVQELVAPGTTLNHATEYPRQVVVMIHRGWTWSVEYNPGGGYVTGDGTIDFIDGLGVSSVNAPPGVTWTSESEVFLAAVAGADESVAPLPTPQLHQNHPNPFNPSTTIAFDLLRDSRVNLRIYDVAGRLVRTLMAGETVRAGRRDVVWHGQDDARTPVATGVYYYRLDADGHTTTRSMVLVR